MSFFNPKWTFSDDFIQGQELWPKEQIGLYAPGNYYCRCRICNRLFEGDKRAILCYPCAIDGINENINNNIGSGI